METSKVSIVTVTYNCQAILKETIESVINQTYPNIEYILIDGDSSDGTVDIIKEYNYYISYWISEPDKGIYEAMNKGVERATGEWIYFLNAGDILYNSNTIACIFSTNLNNVDAIYGDIYFREKREIILWEATKPFFANKKFFHSMGFSHQSIFIRTNIVKNLMFDLSFKCCSDYNMIYIIHKQNKYFKYVKMPIAISEGRYGFSANNVRIQRYEEAKICGVEHTLKFKLLDKYRFMRANIKIILIKLSNSLYHHDT